MKRKLETMATEATPRLISAESHPVGSSHLTWVFHLSHNLHEARAASGCTRWWRGEG